MEQFTRSVRRREISRILLVDVTLHTSHPECLDIVPVVIQEENDAAGIREVAGLKEEILFIQQSRRFRRLPQFSSAIRSRGKTMLIPRCNPANHHPNLVGLVSDADRRLSAAAVRATRSTAIVNGPQPQQGYLQDLLTRQIEPKMMGSVGSSPSMDRLRTRSILDLDLWRLHWRQAIQRIPGMR